MVQFQKKYPYPPQRELLLQTPPPPGISILYCRGCLLQSPTLWNLVEYPLGSIFVSKMLYLLHYVCLCRKTINYYFFYARKCEKILSFMLIRWLIISRTSLPNDKPYRRNLILRTTRKMSSTKEPVTFKLNTT